MEIESRVLAATLDFMQITLLYETPSEEVLPPSLRNSISQVEQKFLKDLSRKIVDTYIVNESNINALKGSIDIGLLTFDDKSRIAHEKTHGMHSQPSASPIPTSVDNVKDDVRNYQFALLEYGMLFIKFHRCHLRS